MDTVVDYPPQSELSLDIVAWRTLTEFQTILNISGPTILPDLMVLDYLTYLYSSNDSYEGTITRIYVNSPICQFVLGSRIAESFI